jgi:hypothetical protein
MAKAKIDWKRVWRAYYQWWQRFDGVPSAKDSRKKIEQLVEAELKAKVKRG